MQRMANYDSLTGLPNRSLFSHLVDQMLVEARRARKSGRYGALMVIEVDRIGAVSDTLGHDIAGELLCEIGRRLRDADIRTRIDGSKFAVALPTIDNIEHVGIVARKLLATLAQPVLIDAHDGARIDAHILRVGARIGVAVCLEDGTDTATLLRFADVAMAKVQRGGDEGFLFYSQEMDPRARRRPA